MKFGLVLIWLFFFNMLSGSYLEGNTISHDENKSLFTKEEMRYLADKQIIKMCIIEESRPIEFFENGKHQGVVGDIFEIFKSQLPIPIKLVPVHDSKEAQKNLSNGTCDIKSIVIKESIPYNYILTTKPYLSDQLVLMTKNDRPYIPNLNESFKDKRFVVRHIVYKIFLQKHFPYLKNIDVINDQNTIIKLLKNDAIYGYIDLAMISNHFIEHFSLHNSIKVNTKIEQNINVSIGIVNTQEQLIPIFNKLITKLSKEYIQNLKNSTSVFYHQKVVDNTLIWQIIGISCILFSLAILVIIKQNRLKNEINEQKETFEKLYLKSSDCIVLADNDIFLDCNEATLKMLQYENKEQFLGSSPAIISPQYQPDGNLSSQKAKEMINLTLQHGYQKFDWVYKKSSGEQFWVEVVLTSIRLSNKNIIHALWRNIEDRKHLEYQSKLLAHQSKKAALGRLLSLIAHQWRQPLSTINGITSKTYHCLNKPSPDIKQIQSEILHIENITHDLSSTINKIHSFYTKEKEFETKTIIKNLIQECIDILYPSFANSLKPSISIHEIDQIYITGYTFGIHQVIITLLKNCEDILIKNNILNPQITINLYKEDQWSCISIKDNGGGIDSEIKNKIFDPYISTNNGQNKMRGLGLNIAKDIVVNHLKGTIEAKNIDDGAIFIIKYEEYEAK